MSPTTASKVTCNISKFNINHDNKYYSDKITHTKQKILTIKNIFVPGKLETQF